MAVPEDDFEFDAVPKFMDFRNDENDGALHDRSAFFYGDGPIHPTPLKPAAVLLKEPAKAKTTPPQQHDVPGPLAELNNFEEGKKKTLGSTSNLALFNPAASRIKERARRRSQQIQVQEEPKPAAPNLSTRRSVLNNPPPRNLPFTRSREAAEKKNLEEAAKKNPFARSHEAPTTAAEQKKPEEKKKPPLGSNSNLALFNPAASRLQERARRRSQQIQVKEDPKPAPRSVLRRPIQQPASPKNNGFARSRELDPRILSSVERLSIPKIRQNSASDAVRSAAGTPKKPAQPILRRQNTLQRAEPSNVPPKLTPDKPEAFKQKLRSYKPPTGKTPGKGLTVPQPYLFHRSTSQCRDADAKPYSIDPKIRESVNRLSAPKKRESAIGPVLRKK